MSLEHEFEVEFNSSNADADVSLESSDEQLGVTLDSNDLDLDIGFDDGNENADVSFSDMEQDFDTDFGEIQVVGSASNYNALTNKPRINGVELIGNETSEDLGIISLPSGGNSGDIIIMGANGATWEAPATSAEQDNTKPITSAAVYTEIGNINALLETI